jgi:hypothetical protein
VAGAPGPRRELGTFPSGGKGPDHYPCWEIVAEMLYMPKLTSHSIWRIFRYNIIFFSILLTLLAGKLLHFLKHPIICLKSNVE